MYVVVVPTPVTPVTETVWYRLPYAETNTDDDVLTAEFPVELVA